MFWKKKEQESINKWSCKLDGHAYKIVNFSASVRDTHNSEPLSPIAMLECVECGKRTVTIGSFWNYLSCLWQQREISKTTYDELYKKFEIELNRQKEIFKTNNKEVK